MSKENERKKFKNAEERHERGFNGVSIPWHVFDMVERRILKAIDVLMLVTIHSFCKQGKCFASNNYLGERIGIGSDRTKQIIAKLKKLDLLKQIAFDGRKRTLAVSYNMDPKTAEKYTKTEKNFQANEEAITRQSGKKLPGRMGGKSQAEWEENPRANREYKGEDLKEEDLKKLSMSDPPGSDGSTETSASLDEEKTIKLTPTKKNRKQRQRKKQPSAFDKKATQEFAKVVSTFRKVQKNSDLCQWANIFRQMREVDGVTKGDIRKTIEWYEKHIGDEFIPEAFSASTFRKKYAEGLFTSAMRRCSQNGNGKSSSNGRNRLTRENMWIDPENMLPSGILKIEIGFDGKEYDGQLLHRVRSRLLERFGQGRPLEEELQLVLSEDFSEEEDLPLSIIGRVG